MVVLGLCADQGMYNLMQPYETFWHDKSPILLESVNSKVFAIRNFFFYRSYRRGGGYYAPYWWFIPVCWDQHPVQVFIPFTDSLVSHNTPLFSTRNHCFWKTEKDMVHKFLFENKTKVKKCRTRLNMISTLIIVFRQNRIGIAHHANYYLELSFVKDIEEKLSCLIDWWMFLIFVCEF